MQVFSGNDINLGNIGVAIFQGNSINAGTVTKGYFYDNSRNNGTVTDVSYFLNNSFNYGIPGNAAHFYAFSTNRASFSGATQVTFEDSSTNCGIINSVHSVFKGGSVNYGAVYSSYSTFRGFAANYGISSNTNATYFKEQANNYVNTLNYLGTPYTNDNTEVDSTLHNTTPICVTNVVFKDDTINFGNVDGNITFTDNSNNKANTLCNNSTGAVFRLNATNDGVGVLKISDATFYDNSVNYGVISSKPTALTTSGNATFHSTALNCGTVAGRANFFNSSKNTQRNSFRGVVCRTARFFDQSENSSLVLRNAYFAVNAKNSGAVANALYFTSDPNSLDSSPLVNNATRSNNAKYLFVNNQPTSCIYNDEQYVNGVNLKHGYYGYNGYGASSDTGDFYFGTGDADIEFFIKFTTPTCTIATFTIKRNDVVWYATINANGGNFGGYWGYHEDTASGGHPDAIDHGNIGGFTSADINTWVHVHFRRANNNTNLYINGVLLENITYDHPYDIASIDFGSNIISNFRAIKGQYLEPAARNGPLTLEGTANGTENITGNVVAYEYTTKVRGIDDSGTTASDSPFSKNQGRVGKYWDSFTNSEVWTNLNSWFTTSDCSENAICLPDKDTDVEILGSVGPTVDLDDTYWLEPKSIKTNSSTITFTSTQSSTVACSITGNVAFTGSAGYGDSTATNWRVVLQNSQTRVSTFNWHDNTYTVGSTVSPYWYLDTNTLNGATLLPVSANNVHLHGTLPPTIDLDIESGKYQRPANTIYTTNANSVIATSQNNNSLRCNIVGTIVFQGNAKFG